MKFEINILCREGDRAVFAKTYKSDIVPMVGDKLQINNELIATITERTLAMSSNVIMLEAKVEYDNN